MTQKELDWARLSLGLTAGAIKKKKQRTFCQKDSERATQQTKHHEKQTQQTPLRANTRFTAPQSTACNMKLEIALSVLLAHVPCQPDNVCAITRQ